MKVQVYIVTALLIVAVQDLLIIGTVMAQELPPPQSHWDYHLGQGLRLGDSGLTLGGYGSARYEILHDRKPQFTLSALSFFLSWDTGTRVRFFSELKFEDVTLTKSQQAFNRRSNSFEIERLYADVYLSEIATLRVGKFLTPIGRWNLIHADPLVWTTSRPLITFLSFAPNTAGGMLYGSLSPLGKDLDYSLYLEVTDDPDADQSEGPFNEVAGVHVSTHWGLAEWGVSYAHFVREAERNREQHLFGADFFWTQNHIEVTGEFLYRVGKNAGEGNEWGLFAQGVVPLTTKLFVVGRYEYFDPRGPFSGMHLWVAGLAFRPLSPLVIRAEYNLAHGNSARVPQGFSASVALLF